MKHPLITPLILNCNDEYWLPYVLEASRGFFDRYVIYDVGSTDKSKDIITWFVNSMKGKAELFVRSVGHIPHPKIQGAFRNSMIAESRSEWYFILDSDELYTPEGFQAIIEGTERMNKTHHEYGQMYGIVPRIEIAADLKNAYGINQRVPHHRIYHRTAIWTGSHPGEVPLYEQKTSNERWINDVTCYHFHNAERSREDKAVPKRLERRARGTYRPGDAEPFDLFAALPLLKEPIEDFPRNPILETMQQVQAKP